MVSVIKVPGETHSIVVTQMVFAPADKNMQNFWSNRLDLYLLLLKVLDYRWF